MPERIQRKRTKGWKMPENTVYVGRPTKWGNPFIPGKPHPYCSSIIVKDKRHAFCLYRAEAPLNQALVAAARLELRGKNLACFCEVNLYPNDGECHADILLELANEQTKEAGR